MKAFVLSAALLAAGSAAHANDVSSLANANNEFGLALSKKVAAQELRRDANANIFFSPVSAAMALQMLLNGSPERSQTYAELASVLRVQGLDLARINAANERLIASLEVPAPSEPTNPMNQDELRSPQGEPPSPFTLTIANSAWGNSNADFAFLPAFVGALNRWFKAEARALDFTVPGSADEINRWASDRTNQKIPRVISADALAPMEFVLMNATYFKASWAKPFAETRGEATFTKADGTQAQTKTMRQRAGGYFEVEGAQVVELPYRGNRASMFVVLPEESRPLASFVADERGPLSTGFWAAAQAADRSEVNLTMPKFGFSYEIKLNDALKEAGMSRSFSNDADFEALSGIPTKVSLVKQNTFVKVDEKGTEAAAVTVVGAVRATSVARPVPEMAVDRPFLVSIVEKSTGTVLFVGAVNSPEQR